MKDQLVELLGVALSAATAAAFAAAIGWLRAHVKNKVAQAVIASLAGGAREADHPETKAAIQARAAANGVENHPAIAHATGGAS